MRVPERVEVKLKLPLLEISGAWTPNAAERLAAWELCVELITRISVVSPAPNEGLLREALKSLHSLFGATREILRHHGPTVADPKPPGEYNFGWLAVAMLNFAVRPVLDRWQPQLSHWEAQRPEDRSPLDHEQAWPQAAVLREQLDQLRQALTVYARVFAQACGVPDLLTAVPAAPPASGAAQ
jgi:hypothetical protein